MKELGLRIIVTIAAFSAVLSVTSCSTARMAYRPYDKEYIPLGFLVKDTYRSSVPGPSVRYMFVYLPESYFDSGLEYPVVYMLHGANGNETSWIRKGRILENIDSLTIDGKAEECIYVFPDMNRYRNDSDFRNTHEKKSIEAFLGLNGSIEYAFLNDVVKHIDSSYRTIPRKDCRAIGGLSLGGLQAMYISANNPDCFGYVGLFSPLIHHPMRPGPYSFFYRKLEQKLRGQFEDPPAFYWIMSGKYDFVYNSAFRFSRYLYTRKHLHHFHVSDGGHTWNNWQDYSIMFIKELSKNLP